MEKDWKQGESQEAPEGIQEWGFGVLATELKRNESFIFYSYRKDLSEYDRPADRNIFTTLEMKLYLCL